MKPRPSLMPPAKKYCRPIAKPPRCAGLVLLMALLLFVPQVQAEVITLRADAWCPYNCDPDSDKPGLIIDIARAVFTPLGHTINYQTMPWSRTLHEVRKGHVTGAVGAVPSEAPDLIYGKNPVAWMDTGFAFNKGLNFHYQGPQSLDPYKIATIKDYHYDEGEVDAYLQSHAHNTQHIQANTGDHAGLANLKKLLAGRVELAIDSHAVLKYLIQQLHLSDKIDLATLGRPNGVYIGFSPADKNSAKWAETLSTGVETLRQKGELAAILARYGLTEQKAP
ncbi:MAG: transporter substrate-binding domain-containing protein [Magnetococcus sp. DMHC-1]|nr:transporter substrate-binding domain-containing protein [Magnetococcales bacterium]